MTNSASRLSVYICVSILGLTIVGKILALIHGSGLLTQPHPFLPWTFEIYIWLALIAELAAFAVLVFIGIRAFLTACLGLAILFITYHILQTALQIATPCPCLGGLLSHWKPLTQVESTLSFLLACGLGIASFVGLFPVSDKTPPPSPPQPIISAAVLAMLLWLVFSLTIVWLWRDHILGGDEGMEAGISFQLLTHPESITRIWNDQPPLFTMVGAEVFRWFGASLTSMRVVVVLIGLLFPLTLAVYCSKAGLKWATVIATILLWLILPFNYTPFMLEAPAYCVGVAALLPLVARGYGWRALGLSALIAALALSIKLTAAFALVVPFVWLWQQSGRRALIWGLLTVALTILGSLVQPGWSWTTMESSHLESSHLNVIAQYSLNPLVYAQGWFISALAVFAVANRYVRNQFAPVVPWLAAAIVALCIHMVHRPFWSYYSVHLMTPVVVLAGIGVVDLWRLTRWNIVEKRIQYGVLTTIVVAFGLWAWQQENEFVARYNQATVISSSPVVKELKMLGESGHTEFSSDPLWTFAAGEPQTPPTLTILPIKRFWSKQINDTTIAQLLASNRVDAVALDQDVLKNSAWTNLLAHYLPAARADTTIVFVRKELNPKPIELDAQTAMLHKLGL